MSKPFVYDEKSSSLYGPDGQFIKKVFCPKAVSWNQLLADQAEDRSRGCNHCDERIINLDTSSPESALAILDKNPKTCVYASNNSANVIYLKDESNPSAPCPAPESWYGNNAPKVDIPIIATARSIEDIERGLRMGFWPDIRLVRYNTKEISQKMCVYQNIVTGEIQWFGDYRSPSANEVGPNWKEVIPWTNFYTHYQQVPVAAYLIPKELPNNCEVLVPDPIEDYVGASWNQGDAYRATNVIGTVINKKIVLNPVSIQRSDFMG